MPTGVHELMRSFAFKIFESMPAKPTWEVVKQAIESLSESWVTIQSRESKDKGAMISVRVLDISSQRVTIPYTIAESEEEEQGGKLKKALELELNHKYARQDDILYGAALSAENPFLFDYISIITCCCRVLD